MVIQRDELSSVSVQMMLSTHPSGDSGQRKLTNQQSHHVGVPNTDILTMERYV